MKGARRYQLGRDVVAVAMTGEEACLEGRLRLRPGQLITVTHVPVAGGVEERSARVHSWYVASLGKEGTTYRGLCRWTGPAG